MKLTVYDFFDDFEDMAPEPSKERIRELTMKKIEESKCVRRPARWVSLVAVAAVVLTLGIAVYAAWSWNGFQPTGGMTQQEIQTLMEQIEGMGASETVDADGTVHYFDSEGTEFMVLTAREAEQFLQAQKEARQTRNEEAASSLIDLSTLPQEPRSITRITTGEDGSFEEFLLGNGSMVLLCGDTGEGYALSAGETVTVSVDASAACIVEFGMFRDGQLLETETVKAETFTQSFTAPEDGVYCFTLMYYSSACDHFTNGSLRIG